MHQLTHCDASFYGHHHPDVYFVLYLFCVTVITFVGPAGLVFFTFSTPLGNIVLFQTHTPLAPLRLRVKFRWFATATMPRILAWYIVGNWIAQWQNDISVWENKLVSHSALCCALLLYHDDDDDEHNYDDDEDDDEVCACVSVVYAQGGHREGRWSDAVAETLVCAVLSIRVSGCCESVQVIIIIIVLIFCCCCA